MSASFAALLAAILGLGAPTTAACPSEHGCGDLTGRVQRAGEREPLANVVVIVSDSPADAPTGRTRAGPLRAPEWSVRVVTDDDGGFVAPSIPRTKVRIVVVADGYVREDRVIDAARSRPVRLFLQPLADAQYRTVVKAKGDAPIAMDVTAHQLADEELRTVPGAQSDALRGAQALPGFARAPFGVGLIVLRGAPPAQSTVMLGEHPVRRAFHALPIAAIVPSDAIETLEIVPSNYSARYGPGTGGLVRIDPARGRRDGHHGHVEADLIAAGAAQEGPLGRGSYLVGGRNAHVGRVLGIVERVDGTVTYPRPTFWDYHGAVGGPIARGVDLHLAVYGAGDRIEQRTSPQPYGYDPPLLTYRGQMHRPSLALVGRTGAVRVLASTALLVSRESFELPLVNETVRHDLQPSWRFEIQAKLHRVATLLLGTDGVLVRRRGTLTTYQHTTSVAGEHQVTPRAATARGIDTSLAAYANVELRGGPVRVVPGARMQAFSTGGASKHALDPRLSIEVAPSDRMRLRAAAGVYSQPLAVDLGERTSFIEEALGTVASRVILPPALLESFEPRIPVDDRPLLTLRRALHVSAGPEVDLPLDITLAATGFARMHEAGELGEIDDNGFRRIYHPQQEGLDAGTELIVRKHLTDRLYGWVAYTVMKSVVDSRPGDFDQRHNLSIVASQGLPRRVRIGARFRLASGNPYTPVALLGGFPIDLGPAVRPERLVLGPTNSARMPAFHQLDLRVDKQWILSRAALAFYVDVQNVYNRENVDLYVYDWDFTATVGTIGLPIFPSVGMRVDW